MVRCKGVSAALTGPHTGRHQHNCCVCGQTQASYVLLHICSSTLLFSHNAGIGGLSCAALLAKYGVRVRGCTALDGLPTSSMSGSDGHHGAERR